MRKEGERETERKSKREREREKEGEGEREREIWNMVIELTGALAPLSYLVNIIIIHAD